MEWIGIEYEMDWSRMEWYHKPWFESRSGWISVGPDRIGTFFNCLQVSHQQMIKVAVIEQGNS